MYGAYSNSIQYANITLTKNVDYERLIVSGVTVLLMIAESCFITRNRLQRCVIRRSLSEHHQKLEPSRYDEIPNLSYATQPIENGPNNFEKVEV
jgi:hypothetical protein